MVRCSSKRPSPGRPCRRPMRTSCAPLRRPCAPHPGRPRPRRRARLRTRPRWRPALEAVMHRHAVPGCRALSAGARGARGGGRSPRARRGTSCSALDRGAGTHGTLRTTEARLDYIAALGFDIVYLPPIHPIGHAFRKGPDNAATAGPTTSGARGRSERARAATRASIPRSERSQTSITSWPRRARAASRSRSTSPSRPRPIIPWVAEHPSWFKARADGSIQYAENPPKK